MNLIFAFFRRRPMNVCTLYTICVYHIHKGLDMCIINTVSVYSSRLPSPRIRIRFKKDTKNASIDVYRNWPNHHRQPNDIGFSLHPNRQKRKGREWTKLEEAVFMAFISSSPSSRWRSGLFQFSFSYFVFYEHKTHEAQQDATQHIAHSSGSCRMDI